METTEAMVCYDEVQIDEMNSNSATAWLLIANLQDLIHKLLLVFLFPNQLHILTMPIKV